MNEMQDLNARLAMANEKLLSILKDVERLITIVVKDLDMIAIQPTDIAHLETLKSAITRISEIKKETT
jgi:hypothetical protein